MKKAALTLLLALLGLMTAAAGPVCPVRGDDTDIEAWVDTHFGRRAVPPFSFKLDGVPSAKLLKRWAWSREPMNAGDPACRAARFVWRRRDGFEVRCEVKAWPEQKVVEWVVRFHNGADVESGQLTDVLAADLSLRFPAKGPFQLHYAEGNKISRADYAPRTKELQTGEAVAFMPAGGRSSAEAFPFYNLESSASGQGAVVAVGWTGTWTAAFCKEDDRQVTFRTGMAGTDLFLHPGEEIRTPSAAFLLWSGARMDGHNRLRRFLLEHHGRKVNGQPVRNLLSSGFNYRDPQPYGEYSAITARWAVAMVERYRQFGLQPDIFWMDAGWHEGAADWQEGRSWATTTGNWTVDRRRFPDGMKPVSDAVHRAGAKFMLWFEPERVVKGTAWAVEHPQWMLSCKAWPEGAEQATWLLLDLGNEEALQWLCKTYGDFIEENGIDYYRQDCNVEPAPYWAENDAPGRRGMKEIRHVENLYRFWDYLLERFPEMVIDNCASGGKRLDWETTARSVPLWRSDYYHYDDPDGYQCHTYGLNFFLPVHGTGILLADDYSFRSSLSSTLIYNWKITGWENSFTQMQRLLQEYRDIRDYFFEDYYPLSGTGDLTGHDVWIAWQMHRPSDGSGVVTAFRREQAPEAAYTVSLQALDPAADYVLTGLGDGETVLSGAALREGLTLRLEQPRSSLLVRYKKLENNEKTIPE